ncbi:hypothetical protein J6590_098387, partial [Homalodisca vitripennis]
QSDTNERDTSQTPTSHMALAGDKVCNRPPISTFSCSAPSSRLSVNHIAAWLLRYRVKHQSSTDNSEFRHRTLRIVKPR